MGDRIRRILRCLSCKKDYMLLLFFWTAGLLAGTIPAVNASESYLSMMRSAAQSQVSIVSLFITALLPFLICAWAAWSGRKWLIYLSCLLKALSFSHGALSAFTAFGSAGWLIQPLLQFTELLLLPFFCWFCLRNLRKGEAIFKDFGVCIVACIVVGYFNFSIVSPFLAMLIDQ